MFLRNQFKGDGVFEIPKIEKEEIELENIELIGYDKLNENETDKIVHFFLDDYKFEAIWNDPEPRIERLRKLNQRQLFVTVNPLKKCKAKSYLLIMLKQII